MIAGDIVLPRGERVTGPSQSAADESDASQSLGRGEDGRKHDDSPFWANQASRHKQPILIAGTENTASK
jgi:hypothetical protein